MSIILWKPAFKNPVAVKPVSYARIFLNPQIHLQNSILTTNLAFVIWIGIGFVELMPQYIGPQLIRIHNSQFSLDSHGKSNALSFKWYVLNWKNPVKFLPSQRYSCWCCFCSPLPIPRKRTGRVRMRKIHTAHVETGCGQCAAAVEKICQ